MVTGCECLDMTTARNSYTATETIIHESGHEFRVNRQDFIRSWDAHPLGTFWRSNANRFCMHNQVIRQITFRQCRRCRNPRKGVSRTATKILSTVYAVILNRQQESEPKISRFDGSTTPYSHLTIRPICRVRWKRRHGDFLPKVDLKECPVVRH